MKKSFDGASNIILVKRLYFEDVIKNSIFYQE